MSKKYAYDSVCRKATLECNSMVESDKWSLKGIEKETSNNDKPELSNSYQAACNAATGESKEVMSSMMSQGGAGGSR
eukprot:285950-Ditylum_brightwellii.AAC.1